MKSTLKKKIVEVMSAVFEVSPKFINEASSPDTIKSWDSLKHMNLIIALEEAFEIEFTDSETVELINFKLIHEIISQHLES
tara:strand:+ start:214 stop:456 length:243 start_codon:yes stop_codon:yes gene_type:complete